MDELRGKIYEKLEYRPKPKDYNLKIPWVVQQQIAATNGIHYVDRIGKLKEYPFYNLPVPKNDADNKLMLDIGSGWGRWLIAGNERGYIPVGVDIRLEFALTAKRIMEDLNIKGYVVVADLREIPFRDSVFDLVWSFSVLQHTHYDRLVDSLKHISRILKSSGFTKLQLPNRNGIRNRRKYVKISDGKKDDINSWVVRYYTIEEYFEIFQQHLAIKEIEIHSLIGLGILPEDLKYVSFKNKVIVASILLANKIANLLKLENIADSLYFTAVAKAKEKAEDNSINRFLQLHNERHDNLNILPLLRCPISGGNLVYDEKYNRLISEKAGVFYPVVDKVPILVDIEAKPL